METKGARILLVDDDKDWLFLVSEQLKRAGYIVSCASDESSAMQVLRQRSYHVAVVDLRLDERNEEDTAGLGLAASMGKYMNSFSSDHPELAIIILTAHADLKSVTQAFQPQSDGTRIAYDYVEKKDVMQLISRIHTSILAVKVFPGLRITLDTSLDWIELKNRIEFLQPIEADTARQELTDLFQRIFFDAEQIHVRPMKGRGHSGGTVALVTPSGRNGIQRTVVVKFDERERIVQETYNYDNYVKEYLEGPFTQRLDFRTNGKLGGIVYSFVSNQVRDFRSFGDVYGTRDAASLRVVLDNLFHKTCSAWYRNTMQPPALRALGTDYQNWLTINRSKLVAAAKDIVESDPDKTVTFKGESSQARSVILFQDPSIGLTNPLDMSQKPFAAETPYCYSHGDLHENNILVDSGDQTWLIDFCQAGLGHPARDFAMLESAIKFTLNGSRASARLLYEWESALLKVGSLTDRFRLPAALRNDEDIVKATEIILFVRALLNQIIPEMTFKDYLVSLYYHSLKGITLRKFTLDQRLHALLSSAIAADVLAETSFVQTDLMVAFERSESQTEQFRNASPALSDTHRYHLNTRLSELKSTYQTLTSRISSVDIDLGRATESRKKQIIREEKEDLLVEREQIVVEMDRIETLLSQ